MKSISSRSIYILITIIAALLFFPFLGKVHLFDWDEINFAEAAREMIITGDFSRVQINFITFWEKPPLFFWMQALSMKIAGINEFAARAPNAIVGIITLNMLFFIGKRLYDKRFALLWAAAYAGSFLPHFYFKTGIIDPVFNLLIFLGIVYLMKWDKKYSLIPIKQIVLSGLFIGLAVLTKGPVALLITVITISFFWLINGRNAIFTFWQVVLWLAAIVVVSFGWYGIDLINNGPSFLVDFINYHIRLFSTQDAGHGGPFYYHIIVLLLGCFPVSVFMFGLFQKSAEESVFQRDFKKWMGVLGFVVLILFSIVSTKIIHYSSLCYLPITYFGAHYLYKVTRNDIQWTKLINWITAIIGGFIGLAILILPIIGKKTELIVPFINDEFAVANLNAEVVWYYWEVIIGIVYIAAVIFVVISFNKKQFVKGALILFFTTLITIQLVMILFIPRIEKYTQGAAIEFYQSIQEEDCYVDVVGFKSYAHLFYSNKQLPHIRESLNNEWLMHGPIDKPVYFVTRIDRMSSIKPSDTIVEIGRKNGFVFLKRNFNTGLK